MGPIAGLAMDAAETAVNTGLGMITAGWNDQRQLKQQGKLNEQQYAIDGRALARQKAAELQQWKDTGPVAMTEQLKRAGLSPALQYGGAGGGGATTGGGGSGVSAPGAPSGGGEVMGIQLMNAQKKLIEAQTANTQADTAKKSGVDTELTAAQGRLARNVAQFYVDTYEDNYDKVKAEVSILENQAKTADQTQMVDVEAKKAELIGLGIANELKRAQKDLTEEQMKATVEMVKQKWEEVSIKQGHLDLDKFIKDVKDSTKLTTESIIRVIGLMK